MSSKSGAVCLNSGTILSVFCLLLYCAGFIRIELKFNDHEARLMAVEDVISQMHSRKQRFMMDDISIQGTVEPVSLLVHYNTPSKISFLSKTARENLAKIYYHFNAKIGTTFISIRTFLWWEEVALSVKRKSVLTVQIILIIFNIHCADLCCIRAIRKLLCAIKQLYKSVISLVDCWIC